MIQEVLNRLQAFVKRLLGKTEKGGIFDSPTLSVIVPAYNVEQYLDSCLTSLEDQTLEDLEVIVIDDGSTDNTLAIARSYAARDPRIRVFSQRNAGLGAVRNRGVELSRGRYITFIDSDDFVPLSAYETMVSKLEATSSDVAIGQIYRRKGRKEFYPKWARNLHKNEILATTLELTPGILRDFYSPNKVYRSTFWKENGFTFREGVLFEDQPLITEVLIAAKSIDILNVLTYCWIVREDLSSLSSNMYTPEKISQRKVASQLTREIINKTENALIRTEWLRIQVDQHLPKYLKTFAEQDENGRTEILGLTSASITLEELKALQGINPINRLLVKLALEGNVELLIGVLNAGIDSPSALNRTIGHDRVTLEIGSSEKSYGKQTKITFLKSELDVKSGVLDVYVKNGSLFVSGWTTREFGLGNSELRSNLQISLVSESCDSFIPLAFSFDRNNRINKIIEDPQFDHSGQGWIAHIALDKLESFWRKNPKPLMLAVRWSPTEFWNQEFQFFGSSIDKSAIKCSVGMGLSFSSSISQKSILLLGPMEDQVTVVEETGPQGTCLTIFSRSPLTQVKTGARDFALIASKKTSANFQYEIALDAQDHGAIHLVAGSEEVKSIGLIGGRTCSLDAPVSGLTYGETSHRAKSVKIVDDAFVIRSVGNSSCAPRLELYSKGRRLEVGIRRLGQDTWSLPLKILRGMELGRYLLKTVDADGTKRPLQGLSGQLPMELTDGQSTYRLTRSSNGIVLAVLERHDGLDQNSFTIARAHSDRADFKKQLLIIRSGDPEIVAVQHQLVAVLAERVPEMSVVWGVTRRISTFEQDYVQLRSTAGIRILKESRIVFTCPEVDESTQYLEGQTVLSFTAMSGHSYDRANAMDTISISPDVRVGIVGFGLAEAEHVISNGSTAIIEREEGNTFQDGAFHGNEYLRLPAADSSSEDVPRAAYNARRLGESFTLVTELLVGSLDQS